MSQNFSSIAFKSSDENGIFSFAGIGKFSSAGIILEFEKKLLNMFGNGVQEIRLPLNEILEIKFRKGFWRFGSKIEIRLNSFIKLAEIPHRNGRILLKIAREDFEEAEETVARMRSYLSEFRHSALGNQTAFQYIVGESEAETKSLEQ